MQDFWQVLLSGARRNAQEFAGMADEALAGADKLKLMEALVASQSPEVLHEARHRALVDGDKTSAGLFHAAEVRASHPAEDAADDAADPTEDRHEDVVRDRRLPHVTMLDLMRGAININHHSRDPRTDGPRKKYPERIWRLARLYHDEARKRIKAGLTQRHLKAPYSGTRAHVVALLAPRTDADITEDEVDDLLIAMHESM
jgi:hypothetical protein